MVKHKVTADGNLTVDGNLKHQIFFIGFLMGFHGIK